MEPRGKLMLLRRTRAFTACFSVEITSKQHGLGLRGPPLPAPLQTLHLFKAFELQFLFQAVSCFLPSSLLPVCPLAVPSLPCPHQLSKLFVSWNFTLITKSPSILCFPKTAPEAWLILGEVRQHLWQKNSVSVT